MRYLFYKDANVLEDLPMNFTDEVYNKFLQQDLGGWEIQKQAEYVLEIDDVLVEPERCLGTKGVNQLIEQTVVFTADYQYPYILPHLLNRKRAKTLDKAVLYDGSATRNLYHHLVETVGRLSLLPKVGLPQDIPIIVNRFVYEKPFFQYLIKNSLYFASLNWRIQEKNEWLLVKKLYRPKALYFGKESWDFTRRMYSLSKIVPTRKIFLNRDKKLYTRGLSNESEICKMLGTYGFEVAYAEHMSTEDQMQLFASTKYLVALTGMGLVQQFFMNYEHAHIIEIMPVNRLMPEYYCEAYSLGIKYYDVVLGDDINNSMPVDGVYKRYEGLKEYTVDRHKLETAVIKMLNAPRDKKIYGNQVIENK